MPDHPSDTNGTPSVKHFGIKPSGVMPRNIQTWVIVGISLLMILIILVSGGRSPKPSQAKAVVPPAPSDPSEARIREYTTRVAEQARRLELEQAELEKTKSALAQNGSASVGGGYLAPTSPAPVRERSWIEKEEEKREYESRYADNIALTRRVEETSQEATSSETNAVPETSQRNTPVPAAPREGRFTLLEGTMIDATLTNRLDGTFAGPVRCMVTNDIYSSDRSTLLIPAGSMVLGEAQRVEGLGQKRLAVAFHRLILPNANSVSLDQFKGLNQVGETGLRDLVDNHYLQLFGASVAIGSLAGLGQATTRYGANQTGTDVYVQGMTSSVSQTSLHILDRFLNILPTITIREGHRVKVYLSSDLLLPAYEKPHPRVL